MQPASVARFDQGTRSFAIYCDDLGQYYCSDGLCTHLQAHLADGRMQDHQIICPMHHAAFDFRTGAAEKKPACTPLQTYPCKQEDGIIWVLI